MRLFVTPKYIGESKSEILPRDMSLLKFWGLHLLGNGDTVITTLGHLDSQVNGPAIILATNTVFIPDPAVKDTVAVFLSWTNP